MDWSISSAAVAADGDLACLSTRAEASLLVQTHLCAWARFWISKPLCVSLTQNCFLLQPHAVQNQPPLLHFIALRGGLIPSQTSLPSWWGQQWLYYSFLMAELGQTITIHPEQVLQTLNVRHKELSTHDGISFSHENKGNLALCHNMSGPWGEYAKWNVRQRKRNTIQSRLYL